MKEKDEKERISGNEEKMERKGKENKGKVMKAGDRRKMRK